MTDGFLTTLVYQGSDREKVLLRFEGGEKDRVWFWRHPGGRWHGPFRKIDVHEAVEGDEGLVPGELVYADIGKMVALRDAARCFGKSPSHIDWRPVSSWP